MRKYCSEANELDIDFVAHGQSGRASGWAINAKTGDFIGVAGPGGPDPLLAPADWHILAGDLTAVPAISAILEQLPERATGQVFIEVDNLTDKHAIACPEGIVINWVLRDISGIKNTLVEAVGQVAPPAAATSMSAFIAGENASVLLCRDKLRNDYQLTRKQLYAIPYWRRGQDEETYHQQRHDIMDQVY